jgi:Tol biopolymer transport system component
VALSPPEYGSRHPAYSWDGTKIVFASDMNSGQQPEKIEKMKKNGTPPKGHTTHLFIMNADGSSKKQLTFGDYQDQRPCFSPDANIIVFVSNRGGSNTLWKLRLDAMNGEPHQLLFGRYGYRPCFSTDGKWVYFFTENASRHQIAKIPADGGEPILLANDNRGNSHGPFADPNGQAILIHSYQAGRYEIFELPIDGSPIRSIQPPGFEMATHATRSQDGVLAFDVIRSKWAIRRAKDWTKRMLFRLIE